MGWDGFDSVELIMDVEDTFGISIPDREAERLHTPGELTAYLIRHLGAGPDDANSKCAGAAAFYRTRRLLLERFGVSRQEIEPGTQIGQLLPPDARARRDRWRELSRILSVRLPRLEHSRRVQKALGTIGLSLSAVGFAAFLLLAAHHRTLSLVSLCLIVGGILIPFIILRVVRFGATYLPAGYTTMGEISSAMMGPEIERLRGKPDGWTRHEIWEFVQWATAKSAGVSPATISRDTAWIRLD